MVVVNNKSVKTLKNEALGYGKELDGSKIKFIDSYSGLVKLESDEEYVVNDPKDFNSIMKKVSEAIPK